MSPNNRLIVLILLLPASADARTICFGETVPGDLLRHLFFSTILIFSVELVFYGVAHLSWMIKKNIWPPVDRPRTASQPYLIAAMALLNSLLLGVWGTFLGPRYRFLLFGESSWNDLPVIVQLLFDPGNFIWLATIAVIALWQTAKHSPKGMRYFGIALFVEIGALYSILWAMYHYTVVLACPVSAV